MYYLSDISEAQFARKKGSKDKRKRKGKSLLKGAAIGTLALGALGLGAYALAKGKRLPIKNQPITVNSPIDKIPITPEMIKDQEKTKTYLRRSKLMSRELKQMGKPNVSKIQTQRDRLNKALKKVRNDPKLNTEAKVRIESKIKKRIKSNQQLQRTAALNAVKNNADYSLFLGDYVAQFARKKGSKDKKKRQSKLGKFLNGELNAKTGKRNVTLREPVIKRAAVGAGVGAAGLSTLGLTKGIELIKQAPHLNKQAAKRLIMGNTKLGLIAGGIVGGTLGAGLGVVKYVGRKNTLKDVKRYEIKAKK